MLNQMGWTNHGAARVASPSPPSRSKRTSRLRRTNGVSKKRLWREVAIAYLGQLPPPPSGRGSSRRRGGGAKLGDGSNGTTAGGKPRRNGKGSAAAAIAQALQVNPHINRWSAYLRSFCENLAARLAALPAGVRMQAKAAPRPSGKHDSTPQGKAPLPSRGRATSAGGPKSGPVASIQAMSSKGASVMGGVTGDSTFSAQGAASGSAPPPASLADLADSTAPIPPSILDRSAGFLFGKSRRGEPVPPAKPPPLMSSLAFDAGGFPSWGGAHEVASGGGEDEGDSRPGSQMAMKRRKGMRLSLDEPPLPRGGTFLDMPAGHNHSCGTNAGTRGCCEGHTCGGRPASCHHLQHGGNEHNRDACRGTRSLNQPARAHNHHDSAFFFGDGDEGGSKASDGAGDSALSSHPGFDSGHLGWDRCVASCSVGAMCHAGDACSRPPHGTLQRTCSLPVKTHADASNGSDTPPPPQQPRLHHASSGLPAPPRGSACVPLPDAYLRPPPCPPHGRNACFCAHGDDGMEVDGDDAGRGGNSSPLGVPTLGPASEQRAMPGAPTTLRRVRSHSEEFSSSTLPEGLTGGSALGGAEHAANWEGEGGKGSPPSGTGSGITAENFINGGDADQSDACTGFNLCATSLAAGQTSGWLASGRFGSSPEPRAHDAAMRRRGCYTGTQAPVFPLGARMQGVAQQEGPGQGAQGRPLTDACFFPGGGLDGQRQVQGVVVESSMGQTHAASTVGHPPGPKPASLRIRKKRLRGSWGSLPRGGPPPPCAGEAAPWPDQPLRRCFSHDLQRASTKGEDVKEETTGGTWRCASLGRATRCLSQHVSPPTPPGNGYPPRAPPLPPCDGKGHSAGACHAAGQSAAARAGSKGQELPWHFSGAAHHGELPPPCCDKAIFSAPIVSEDDDSGRSDGRAYSDPCAYRDPCVPPGTDTHSAAGSPSLWDISGGELADCDALWAGLENPELFQDGDELAGSELAGDEVAGAPDGLVDDSGGQHGAGGVTTGILAVAENTQVGGCSTRSARSHGHHDACPALAHGVVHAASVLAAQVSAVTAAAKAGPGVEADIVQGDAYTCELASFTEPLVWASVLDGCWFGDDVGTVTLQAASDAPDGSLQAAASVSEPATASETQPSTQAQCTESYSGNSPGNATVHPVIIATGMAPIASSLVVRNGRVLGGPLAAATVESASTMLFAMEGWAPEMDLLGPDVGAPASCHYGNAAGPGSSGSNGLLSGDFPLPAPTAGVAGGVQLAT
eukprot:jgi/Mesvir1/8378/Mv12625-RA.2